MPKIILERHAHAPELNKAHILCKGRIVGTLPAPRAENIAAVRNQLFRRIYPARIIATVRKEYPAPWQGLSRTWQGITPSRLSALAFMRAQRAKTTSGIRHAQSYNHSKDTYGNHTDAASNLAIKIQKAGAFWAGNWIGADLPGTAGMVWVSKNNWSPSFDVANPS